MLENIKKIIPEMEKSDSQSFYNNAIKTKETKKITLPKKMIISFALIVILLAIIIPVGMNMFDSDEGNGTGENNNSYVAGDVNPGKDKYIATEYFDSFYAFGSGSPSALYSSDVLLKSNILSDESKDILRQSENVEDSFYNVYFGIKDGVDCVVLSQLNAPYAILVFESNFDYSFTECINEFQEMCGKEITQDFLISSKFDNLLKKEISGILICLEIIDGKYIVYYTLELNGKLYILNK